MADHGPPSASVRLSPAERDIEEVRRQEAEGELDPATARMLIRRYRREMERAEPGRAGREGEGGSGITRTNLSRRVVGGLLLVAILAGVAVTTFQAVRPRQGGFVTGDIGGPVDLAAVTNDQMEAVIAANPDVPRIAAMRLSLADRYFEEGDFSSALAHYLEALEGSLDRTRRARALARVGWMSYLSGAGEVAEAYLAGAREIDPDYRETSLFLGLIRLRGGDPAGALASLEPLLATDGLPPDTRTIIEEAVAEARNRTGAGG